MGFTPPPPKNKKQAGTNAAFVAYIKAHPYLRDIAPFIYQSAKDHGLDPVYYAALISFESARGTFRQHPNANPTGHGWAQINPQAHKIDPRTGQKITMAQLNNPKWNIEFGAYLFSIALKQNGSYEAAYRGKPGSKSGGYNHGWKGVSPFATVPKDYISTAGASSPEDKARLSVEQSAATKQLTDPYVTIRNGKLVNVSDPKKALHVFGAPITRSQFMQSQSQLNDLFLSYTGKNITSAYVAKILQKGYSRYQLINAWTKRPDFQNSPVWKQQAPGYQSVWSQIYGPDSKPDQEALRYAIVNNLGGEGFASTLRSRPDYVKSNEFKGAESSLSAVYTKIYGVPDVKAENLVKQATLHGWNPDQFAAYLRSQPQYTGSEEYQSRAIYFATQLGLLTGAQPTMVPGKLAPNTNLNTQGTLATDPRAPKGAVSPTNDLVIGPAPGKPTGLAGVVQ